MKWLYLICDEENLGPTMTRMRGASGELKWTKTRWEAYGIKQVYPRLDS